MAILLGFVVIAGSICLENTAITLNSDMLPNFWAIRIYLKARLKDRKLKNATTSFEYELIKHPRAKNCDRSEF
ncbi:MAG: hypothetical protein AAGF83_23035 [Cyanobacteria bacterium P01_G01_bin.67]